MAQEIFRDEHGVDTWDQQQVAEIRICIVNSAQWAAITGEASPRRR